jgi:hypothetical protein
VKAAAVRGLPAPHTGGPRGPLLPAALIAELILPLVAREGPGSLARRCGLPARRIFEIVSGRQAWVSFDVADRLITHGLRDPGLWHRHAELAAALPPLLDEEEAVA